METRLHHPRSRLVYSLKGPFMGTDQIKAGQTWAQKSVPWIKRIPNTHLLHVLSISVTWCQSHWNHMEEEGWRPRFRKTALHWRCMHDREKKKQPFYMSELGARGIKYMMKPSSFLDNTTHDPKPKRQTTCGWRKNTQLFCFCYSKYYLSNAWFPPCSFCVPLHGPFHRIKVSYVLTYSTSPKVTGFNIVTMQISYLYVKQWLFKQRTFVWILFRLELYSPQHTQNISEPAELFTEMIYRCFCLLLRL